MKIRHSFEFGRRGPEGITGEGTNEKIYDPNEPDKDENDYPDGSEIRKILDGLDMDIDDDYEDCRKEDNNKSKEEEKEDDFSDCLKESTKTEKEVLKEDVKKLEEALEIVDESKKEIEDVRKSIDEIFG